ncbi:MAG: transposase family protein [Planctomycetota bacterium]
MSAAQRQPQLPFAENGQWLTVSEAAARADISERQVVVIAAKNATRGLARLERPDRGGKPQWMLHVNADRRLSKAPSVEDSVRREALLQRFPVDAVNSAFRKFRWLNDWEKAVERGSPGETEIAIAERVVRQARMVDPDFPFTVRTLQRWRRSCASIGPDGRRMGIEGLIDRRELGNPIFAESTTRSPEAIALFNDLYRTNGRPTMKSCHDVALYDARKQGWQWPATYSATRQWHEKHDDLSVTLLLREGPSAWSRKFLPHVEIDYSTLEPGEMYVADHHQCDFWVLKGSEQIRPWLTAVQDLKSRCIVGWHLGSAPHQDAIVAALRMAFRDWAIPRRMKLDNGKDFKSKLLTGLTSTQRARLKAEYGPDWRKVEERDAHLVACDDTLWSGILGELKIEVQFTLPYSPWSKGTMERWFGTFESQLGKTMPTYCGNNVLKKPECLDAIRRGYTSEQKKYHLKKHGRDWWKQVVLKFVDEAHVPTMDEAREDVGDFIELYHHDTHNFDHVSGMIPLQTWRTAKTLRKAEDDALLLFMQARGVYKVTGNGIGFKVGAGYHSYGDKCPLLKRLVGREVFITIDPDDISFCTAWTADEKGRRFIARLESNERIPPHTPIDAEREVIAQKKREQSVMQKASRSGARRHLSASERFRQHRCERVQQLKKTGTYDATADISVVRNGFEGTSKPTPKVVEVPDKYTNFDLIQVGPEPKPEPDWSDSIEELFKDDGDAEWDKARVNHNLYCDLDDPDCPICSRSVAAREPVERKPLALEDLLMSWQRRAEDSGTEALSDDTEQDP